MASSRLSDAASLYLRQHADDPVDWYEWGPAAFEAAQSAQRPIFLSVGYSACHWCHVMQRESFRDPETAELLNRRFVPVKVDRELRPDVDALYMDYVVATTGHGGWPMSLVLTPDLLPLLGGTYFPKEPMGDLPSLCGVLNAADEAFSAGGGDLERVSQASLAFLREQAGPRPARELDRGTLDTAAEYLLRSVDTESGGFGTGTKFPEAPLLLFLARYQSLAPDPGIAWSIETTLTSMIRGGVYDQAGGGLFRYAVDRRWRTPHFEKMLYDNGLLLSSLAAAAPLASDDAVRAEYAHVAHQTALFLRRELTAPEGGLYASLAADTAGLEGATYLWTRAQLETALAPAAYRVALAHLGADSVTEPFTLTRSRGRDADADVVDGVLEFIAGDRARRPQPEADTKVVTSWNMIAARGLMEAGMAFSDSGMSALGLETLVSVLDMSLSAGTLRHVADDPSVADVRLIEDHAHAAAACLTAHQATGDPVWIDRAAFLHRETLRRFADGDALYMTPAGTELPVRPREQGDQPTPSGAATAVENALLLAEATGDEGYREFARQAIRRFWALADAAPEHAGKALECAARMAGA